MNDDDDMTDDDTVNAASVVRFPQSRVRPPSGTDPFIDLGMSKMVGVLGGPNEQTSGHWCSQCKGIWFGHLLEVECPVCGSRRGGGLCRAS